MKNIEKFIDGVLKGRDLSDITSDVLCEDIDFDISETEESSPTSKEAGPSFFQRTKSGLGAEWGGFKRALYGDERSLWAYAKTPFASPENRGYTYIALSGLVIGLAAMQGIRWFRARHAAKVARMATNKAVHTAQQQGLILEPKLVKKALKKMIKDPMIKARLTNLLAAGKGLGSTEIAMDKVADNLARELVKNARRMGAVPERGLVTGSAPIPPGSPNIRGFVHPPGLETDVANSAYPVQPTMGTEFPGGGLADRFKPEEGD